MLLTFGFELLLTSDVSNTKRRCAANFLPSIEQSAHVIARLPTAPGGSGYFLRRIRWTSTRKEFEPTISPIIPPGLFFRRLKSPRFGLFCFTRAYVAAPATNPVAATAVTCFATTAAGRRRSGKLRRLRFSSAC